MEFDLTLQEAADIEDVWKLGAEDNIWIRKKKVIGEKCKWGATKFLPYIKPYSGYNTKVDACS
jgi:hypothetical protein